MQSVELQTSLNSEDLFIYSLILCKFGRFVFILINFLFPKFYLIIITMNSLYLLKGFPFAEFPSHLVIPVIGL